MMALSLSPQRTESCSNSLSVHAEGSPETIDGVTLQRLAPSFTQRSGEIHIPRRCAQLSDHIEFPFQGSSPSPRSLS